MAIDQKDRDYIAELLEKLLPMAVMAGVSASKPKDMGPPFDRSMCAECKQMRGACKGEHEKVVAYPSGDEFEEFFQGFTLNGIRYNSGHGRQPITVPKGSGVANQIALWEQQEKNQRYGIKRTNVTHRLASTV